MVLAGHYEVHLSKLHTEKASLGRQLCGRTPSTEGKAEELAAS